VESKACESDSKSISQLTTYKYNHLLCFEYVSHVRCAYDSATHKASSALTQPPSRSHKRSVRLNADNYWYNKNGATLTKDNNAHKLINMSTVICKLYGGQYRE
jgi:hypothetical protein